MQNTSKSSVKTLQIFSDLSHHFTNRLSKSSNALGKLVPATQTLWELCNCLCLPYVSSLSQQISQHWFCQSTTIQQLFTARTHEFLNCKRTFGYFVYETAFLDMEQYVVSITIQKIENRVADRRKLRTHWMHFWRTSSCSRNTKNISKKRCSRQHSNPATLSDLNVWTKRIRINRVINAAPRDSYLKIRLENVKSRLSAVAATSIVI